MRRCPHGIYLPDGDEKAWGCQSCYPQGHLDTPVPVLPRSSGDPLNSNRTESLPKCECGAIALSTRTRCGVCGLPYPYGLSDARTQGTANERAPGTCPDCGSNIHYETKKPSEWECADCGTKYPAPKGRRA